MALSNEKREFIDTTIEEILCDTNKSYPEDDLGEIILSYNNDITLWEYDFKEDSHKISGAIAYPESGEIRILINKDLPPARKTFTLAHEFGHFVLHNGERKFRLDFSDQYTDREANDEVEANYFAGALLMPENMFRMMDNILHDDRLLARRFGVSVSAVRVRKKCLKINLATN